MGLAYGDEQLYTWDIPRTENYTCKPTRFISLTTSKIKKDLSHNGKDVLYELPNELTLDNAINILQELAQKGYISMPEYYQTDYQVHDGEGNSYWECCCYVNSHSVAETAYGTSKKIAKKYSAYMCICKICNLRDEYSNED